MDRKTILLMFWILLSAFPVLSQEKAGERFSYRSFSISPLGGYFGSNSGMFFNADVSFDYGGNIFSLEIGDGSETGVGIFGHNDHFREVNFLYERSFTLNEIVFAEVFLGAGYFQFNTYGVIDPINGKKGEIERDTVGFPIGAKVQFRLGPRYSMGVKFGGNINSVETVGIVGLVLQWNRKGN